MFICGFIGDILYFEAHWIFCWRYWKVANLLARVKKDKHYFQPRIIEGSNWLMTALILAGYGSALINRLTDGSNKAVVVTTEVALPCIFILIDMVVLGCSVL